VSPLQRYGTADFDVPAVVKLHIVMTAATTFPTPFGDLVKPLDIFHG